MNITHSFIFFGCWNNINCNKDYIYRDIVLNSIREFENDIQDVFIAGDNWYSTLIDNIIKGSNDSKSSINIEKEIKEVVNDLVDNVEKNMNESTQQVDKKKQKKRNNLAFKYYLIDTLVSGYHILYGMNKNIYICVGNHDESSIHTDNNKDCMIRTQKYYIKKIKEEVDSATENIDTLLLEDNIPNLKDIVDDRSLETNIDIDNKNTKMKLYSHDKIGIEEKSSYIVFIINTNILSDTYLNSLKDELSKYKEEKSDNLKKIFVMGHIPLFFDKHKDPKEDEDPKEKGPKEKGPKEEKDQSLKKSKKRDKTDIKKGKFNNSYDMIDKIYMILTDYNCTYICADCHNFNVMKIKCDGRVLIQITCGTGGADPDKIIDIYDTPKTSVFKSNRYKSESSSPQKSSERQEIQYDLLYYSINSYGYSKISVVDNNIIVSYNKLIDIDSKTYIDDKYRYIISNNNIIYLGREVYKNNEKINYILENSLENKNKYCKRLDDNKAKNISNPYIDNIIKTENKKTVCYKKKKD